MGSPLGPTFASFYMCHIENQAFQSIQTKPKVYCRYVDDCFLVIDHIRELNAVKNYLEDNSVLTFTYELEINKRLPFLDVLITRNNFNLTTDVFTKPTSSGECLNFKSLCPMKYKLSVIQAFVHRAFAITSSWDGFHSEIQRIRRLLSNNNFPIALIDKQIQKFINGKFDTQHAGQTSDNSITLYYRNQFTSNAKTDEVQLKQAITRNVAPTDNSKQLNLIVFYRNRKLKSLFINNKTRRSEPSDRVVYQYSCNQGGCNSATYIGYTTCSLAKRFYMHVQSGAIRKHNKDIHNRKPLTKELLQHTSILYKGTNKVDLTIAEALLIKLERPPLNLQDEGQARILNIF
jgi:hypothetical protein